MFIRKFISMCIATALSLRGTEIRYIMPPKLELFHLGEKILCHRPMRRGSPNMSVEQKDGKIIAHNYGHGGGGWTLGPGSAEIVNRLLLNFKDAHALNHKSPITIVGAGALGLFTAYDLEQKGFKNITIVASNFEGLTSHHAGGLFAPVSMDNCPEIQEVIDQTALYSYKFYASIAKKEHQHFKDGAVIMPAYFENREDSGLEPYVGKVINPAKDVILDFGNGTQRNMIVYDDGIFIDTAEMMSGLSEYLEEKNVAFVQKKVNAFSDLNTQFIINCTGIASKELNKDDKMISVQGHLTMLKNQNPQDLQYMILAHPHTGKTQSAQKAKRSFYIFPKHSPNTEAHDVGVIGGTYIENATNATPNEEEYNILIQEAKNFYGIE